MLVFSARQNEQLAMVASLLSSDAERGIAALSEWLEQASLDAMSGDEAHMAQGDLLSLSAAMLEAGDGSQAQSLCACLVEGDALMLAATLMEAELLDEESAKLCLDALNTPSEPETEAHSEPPKPQLHLSEAESSLELDEEQREILTLLEAELEDIAASEIDLEQASPEDWHHQATSLASRYEHLANVCAMIDLKGLKALFQHLQNQYEALSEAAPVEAEHLKTLGDLREQSLHYVRDFFDPLVAQALVSSIASREWLKPWPEAEVEEDLAALISPSMGNLHDDRPQRATRAQPEDVDLAIPDDVNAELLDSLLGELPDQTAGLNQALQETSRHHQQRDLEIARRLAHTLKGAANVVGIRGIAQLTHHMEDILDALAKYALSPSAPLASVLLDAADTLEAMGEFLLGQGEAPEAQATLQDVLDWANRIDREGAEALAGGQPLEAKRDGDEAAATTESDGGNNERSLRISYRLVDELMRLAGEHSILAGQMREQTEVASQHMKGLRQRGQYLRGLALELEQQVDVRRYADFQREESEDLDGLELERYSELHTVTHRLLEAVDDVYEHLGVIEESLLKLGEAQADQTRMNMAQQETVMQTRMVPVKSIAPRLQRSVRQACRLANKTVNLSIEGESLAVDSDILAGLTDPIMHLLRNAIDHGIEEKEQRIAAGKPECGHIFLCFEQRGDQLLISCQDDGGGLDYQGIRQRGIERGLIAEDEALDREALSRVILSPGFSTRDEASQLSGRGVGLDIVFEEVNQLNGVLQVTSNEGVGTRFDVALPTRLHASHSLIVRCAEQRFVVATHGIEEIVFAEIGEFQEREGRCFWRSANAGGQDLPVIDVAAHLTGKSEPLRSRAAHTILRCDSGLGYGVALLVGQVMSSRDIVIKPLGSWLPSPPGVAGATILGDGEAVPVLDMPSLVNAIERGETLQVRRANRQRQRRVLVVDDSLSTRRSLVQFVEDMGLRAHTAKDGVEGIEQIKQHRPDVILSDLEMPRMNGLEMSAQLKADADMSSIPIVMITSRSSDKHRDLAEQAGVDFYLTKPYSEEQLLQTIHQLLPVERSS